MTEDGSASAGGTVTLIQLSTDPRRTASSLSDALAARFEAVERPSVRFTAALVGCALAAWWLAAGTPALAWLGETPSWVPTVLLTTSAAAGVAVMPLALLPTGVMTAWSALAYLSATGNDEWLRAMGEPLPDASAADAWVRDHPGPEFALQRAQILIMHGRGGEAVLPDEADLPLLSSRFLRAQLAWLDAFAAENDPAARGALARLERLADQQNPGQDASEARAVVLMVHAFEVHAKHEDWLVPLVEARRELGSLADGVVARRFVLPRLQYYGRISLVIFVATQLIDLALRSV